ncbi:MAG: 2-(1,2-epoxy-1,2-dihydrophenyl)acetyl-CoA isomerase [Betaproteobacteria bacterium]|nr:2-(1,2-epoxy-1,2-dihydrophenyl)acetyl-CoA isomerase [Betaproteobacteria bacterium]
MGFTVEQGVATITLNRPGKLNSFNEAMHGELRQALARVRDSAQVKVLILTGAGRAFCAGQDLGERRVPPGGTPVDLGDSIERNYTPLVLGLRALPKPVIGAVNGVAAGAGANVALACDVVVAARSASFVQPFARLGLVPDCGGTHFLVRRLGTQRALGLSLFGDSLSAELAEQWGLIWKCVDDDALSDTVRQMARQLAAGPALGYAHTKAAVYAAEQNALAAQLELERDYQRQLGFSHDYREGVAAFLERRPPNFTGA